MSSFTNTQKSNSSFDSSLKSGFPGYIVAEEDNLPAFTLVGADEDFILTFDDGVTWYNIEKSS